MNYRPLSNTGLQVSEVALGCWPIAGMTSPGTSDQQSIATIQACFDLGINHLDTAYMYGPNGESERLIARALAGRRNEMVIATKCGLHWSPEGRQAHDGRPATLRRQCEESLRRLADRSRGVAVSPCPRQECAGCRIGRRAAAADGGGKDAGRGGVEPRPAAT